MKTLFNISDFQATAKPLSSRNHSRQDKLSKFSRPNLRGIASIANAQRVLNAAKSEILGMFGHFCYLLKEETHTDGTALLVVERYEEGEAVLYQYDIDQCGTYCEIRL